MLFNVMATILAANIVATAAVVYLLLFHHSKRPRRFSDYDPATDFDIEEYWEYRRNEDAYSNRISGYYSKLDAEDNAN